MRVAREAALRLSSHFPLGPPISWGQVGARICGDSPCLTLTPTLTLTRTLILTRTLNRALTLTLALTLDRKSVV